MTADKKLIPRIFIGIFLALGLYFSSCQARLDFRSTNEKIFDVKGSQSWAELKPLWGGPAGWMAKIVSLKSTGDKLLSREEWADFELTFQMLNSRNFGIIFDYLDDNDLFAVVFNFSKEEIIWQMRKDGQRILVSSQKYPITASAPFVLAKKDGEIRLYQMGQVISAAPAPIAAGKIGLLATEPSPPRTEIGKISLSGHLKNGEFRKFPFYTERNPYRPGSFVSLYFFLLAGGFYIFNFSKPARLNFRSYNASDIVFNTAAVFLGMFIFFYSLQVLMDMRFHKFSNTTLVQCLEVSLGGYFLIGSLAFGYAKVFRIATTPFLFLVFLFGFYFLCLLNLLTFKIEENVFIRFVYVMLWVPLIFKLLKRKKGTPAPRENPASSGPDYFVNVLFLLWMLFSVFYFLEYNFTEYRYPMSDEETLWFPAAKDLLYGDVLASGKADYPGGGMHPLGVPFVAALPGKLLGLFFTQTIFFMPLCVTAVLALFLRRIKSERWVFLFFLTALFSSFQFHWLGHWFYRSLYGEGLSAVFFLMLMYEIFRSSEATAFSREKFLLFSAGVGLLALTKIPASYIFPIFSLVLISLFAEKRPVNVKALIAGAVVSFLPFLAWKVYVQMYSRTVWPARLQVTETGMLNWNGPLLKGSFDHIVSEYTAMAVLGLLSLAFILAAFRKKELFCLLPIVSIFLGVVVYYGLFYGGDDFMSFARYMMHPVLGLFFLGAVGFDRLIFKKFNIVSRKGRG